MVWAQPRANDNSGLLPALTCSLEPGSRFHIGRTEVDCEARDLSGNKAFCVFTIEVRGN